MVKIWESYRKQQKRTQKLPIVIPIVIYHGKDKWKFKHTIGHLFNQNTDTLLYIPDFRSEIFDISHIPDNQIVGELLLRVPFLNQKYIFSPKLLEKLPEILHSMNTLARKTKATEYRRRAGWLCLRIPGCMDG